MSLTPNKKTYNAPALMTATAISAGVLATATTSAHADEALADLVEDVSPAVVTVLSTMDTKAEPADLKGFDFPRGTPFDEFFRQFGPDRGNGFGERFGQAQPRQGLGSGFILDADGWIVTNHHVVDGAAKVTVRLADNREFTAEVVGTDEQTDLAVLRIETEDALPFVTLGDSSEIRVGDTVRDGFIPGEIAKIGEH